MSIFIKFYVFACNVFLTDFACNVEVSYYLFYIDKLK